MINQQQNYFRVAMLQLEPDPLNPAYNLKKGLAACRRAAEMCADLVLFPEMWNTGYLFFDANDPERVEKWLSLSMDTTDFWLQEFRKTAQSLNIAVGVTYLGRGNDKPRNSFALFDHRGVLVLQYDKVHICAFSDLESRLEPGEGFRTTTLDIGSCSVEIGTMICFDREFPESSRTLMLKGAEFILTPNACELETHRIEQYKTRAFENMTGMIMTNYPRPLNNGHSMAVSPIAFAPDETSMNTVVAQCGDEEEIKIAEFNIDSIRRYRKREVWGAHCRRPELYSNHIRSAQKGDQ